jgi:transmembrane sensor
MDNKKAKDFIKKFREEDNTVQDEKTMKYWLHHLHENGPSGLSEKDLLEAQQEMWEAVKPKRTTLISHRLFPAMAVAASLLIVASVGLYSLKKQQHTEKATARQIAGMIVPGGNKAILTLSNGKKIILNDAANGQLSKQSGISISKTIDGQLIYTAERSGDMTENAKELYNTIETPKGGQYQINLSDGSKVWLNALSKLRFPARFTGKERKVELSGEGYFEIAHDQTMPFRVSSNSQIVEVLGTHFNINSYNDEENTRTTLLEGSVKVIPAMTGTLEHLQTAILKPGEQSLFSGSNIQVIQVDAQSAVAWKNGYFRFDDESLESIMRKVARWYDVTVIFKDERMKKEPFAGVITRFSKVEDLLKMLEMTQEVKFTLTGKTISVMDKNQQH